MNLLSETREAIRASGHEPADIVFIGSTETGHRCTWAEFEILADFDYDDGFGAQHIATDLTVVFTDGQTMWRHEYDGSERWDYSAPVALPEAVHAITSLGGPGIMWDTLAEINSAASAKR